jgi:hypothetical protein
MSRNDMQIGIGLPANIPDYYGAEWGPMVVQSMPVTPEAIKETRKAFADIGTDELIFWPCLADLDQIDRLEDVLG